MEKYDENLYRLYLESILESRVFFFLSHQKRTQMEIKEIFVKENDNISIKLSEWFKICKDH